jgi:predicted transcriptional regulator
VAVIFHETREVAEKNRELKEALKKLGRDDSRPPGTLAAVAVADCSGAFWPFTRIWRSKLIENSKKEGLTIYGDWDGTMRSDYGMKSNESNVIVVDGTGIIRYSKAGKITGQGINELQDILKKLVSETARTLPKTGKRVEKSL